jgi:hypothetical protein
MPLTFSNFASICRKPQSSTLRQHTMVMDDWSLTGPNRAISGSVAQCHYVKQ